MLAHVYNADTSTELGAISPVLTATWQEYSFQFTPTAAVTNYSVAFLNSKQFVNGNPPYVSFGIDSVSLTAVSTPEPSALVLLGAGLLSLLAYAWRKRK